MRSNIEIDDELLAKALAATGLRTRRAMVDFDLLSPALAAHRRLRDLGLTLTIVDTFIGSYCLQHGCRLLTRDRDFDPLRDHPCLVLIDPATFGDGPG
jgi:predicted nucleic acid-binding protein